MKVILLQNIKGLGQIGDVKNVSDGYGRNFLLPKKFAKPATEASLKEVDELKRKLAAMQEIEKRNIEEAAEKFKDMALEIIRKASPTGTLYDGVDKIDIADKIREATNINLAEEMIKLDEKIKKVGEYMVEVNFTPDIKTQIKLTVKAED